MTILGLEVQAFEVLKEHPGNFGSAAYANSQLEAFFKDPKGAGQALAWRFARNPEDLKDSIPAWVSES